MKPERILLPLNIRKCPLEVFSVVNGLATPSGATVTLLHVITLNLVAPEKGVYEELGRDARWYLERLARGCLRPDLTALIRVRVGRLAEEILAEAAAGNADLIVLPCYPPSACDRLIGRMLPRLVERVSRRAPCGVLRASVQGRFNCEDAWGRSRGRMDAGSGHLDGTPESDRTAGLPTKATLAIAREPHRAIA